MKESNGSPEPSHGPDFKSEYDEAQATGDFSFVMKTARDSDKMLRDFKQAVLSSSFLGRDTRSIAMGLSFLDNMTSQSAAQLEQLKRTEKVTREAIKAARSKMSVVGPEDEPSSVTPEPEAPAVPEPAVPPAPAVPEATSGDPVWNPEGGGATYA